MPRIETVPYGSLDLPQLMSLTYDTSGTDIKERRAAVAKIINCQPKKVRAALQKKDDGEGFSMTDLAAAISEEYAEGDPTSKAAGNTKEKQGLPRDLLRNSCFVQEEKCFQRSSRGDAMWYQIDNRPDGFSHGIPHWIPDPKSKTARFSAKGPKFKLEKTPEVVSPMQGNVFSGCDTHSDCKKGSKKCKAKGGVAQCNYIKTNECGCYKAIDANKQICKKSSSGERDAPDMD